MRDPDRRADWSRFSRRSSRHLQRGTLLAAQVVLAACQRRGIDVRVEVRGMPGVTTAYARLGVTTDSALAEAARLGCALRSESAMAADPRRRAAQERVIRAADSVFVLAVTRSFSASVPLDGSGRAAIRLPPERRAVVTVGGPGVHRAVIVDLTLRGDGSEPVILAYDERGFARSVDYCKRLGPPVAAEVGSVPAEPTARAPATSGDGVPSQLSPAWWTTPQSSSTVAVGSYVPQESATYENDVGTINLKRLNDSLLEFEMLLLRHGREEGEVFIGELLGSMTMHGDVGQFSRRDDRGLCAFRFVFLPDTLRVHPLEDPEGVDGVADGIACDFGHRVYGAGTYERR